MTEKNGAQTPRVALVTGASRGLGRAFTQRLVRGGWHVVIDARDHVRLIEMVDDLAIPHAVTAIPGDVADPSHRALLAEAVAEAGGLDLLVNNASVLGPSPQPGVAEYPLEVLKQVYAVNTFAPLALFQAVLPQLGRRSGRVVNVSSDAAVEAYAGWGGYGSAKAGGHHRRARAGVRRAATRRHPANERLDRPGARSGPRGPNRHRAR